MTTIVACGRYQSLFDRHNSMVLGYVSFSYQSGLNLPLRGVALCVDCSYPQISTQLLF